MTDSAVTTFAFIHDHSFSRTVAAVVVQFVDQPDRNVWSGVGDGNSRRLAGAETGFAGLEKNPTAYGARTAAHRRGAGWVNDINRRRVSDYSRDSDRHDWI